MEKKKFLFRHRWIWLGVCVSLIMALLFTCFYGSFEREANANMDSPLESVENMSYMYKNCYVLYRDLYNRQNQTDAVFHELYLSPLSGYESYGNEEYLRKLEQQLEQEEYGEEVLEDTVTEEIELSEIMEGVEVTEGGDGELSLWEVQDILQTISSVDGYFQNLESNFSQLNQMFDYLIEDTVTGEYITNLTDTDINQEEQFFYVSFLFDEYGNVSVDNTVQGSDVTRIRKNANEVIRSGSMEHILEELVGRDTSYRKVFQTAMPVNCRVTFCISNVDWNQMMGENGDMRYGYFDSNQYYTVYMVTQRDAYNQTHCGMIYVCFLLAMGALAFFLPAKLTGRPWQENKLCKVPLEVLYALIILLFSLGSFVVSMVMWINSGEAVQQLQVFVPAAGVFAHWLNFMALGALFFGAWYLGLSLRGGRELGFKETIRQRLFLYRIFPFIKSKLLAVYEAVSHFDVTRNANKLILKIVLVNAVILFLICSLWMGGLAVAIIYSVILYVVLRKYISDLQKRYGILLKATNEIAQGNLNVTITEDLGVFEPFKPQIICIEEGFKKAVEEEVKSQRMKTELITNVSHDLKTPLTAIITYINLLKEENITEEQRKEYLETLERKSLRLKVLIEDLFEVSKANSKNITLNIMDVDVINLVKQVAFEMSDKLMAANLDVRLSLPEEKVIVPLDSQKTYRIFENLFGNIAKYSLPGTRVYVNGVLREDGVEITLKNITAEEIRVTPEELTERFVRGDASRNTEGSGLGLAIAKSFTELQGGKLDIQMDGDLFKVSVFWKLAYNETNAGCSL